MFSESSTGHWAVLQLLYCPSEQDELAENSLHNLFHNLTPQSVDLCIILARTGSEARRLLEQLMSAQDKKLESGA